MSTAPWIPTTTTFPPGALWWDLPPAVLEPELVYEGWGILVLEGGAPVGTGPLYPSLTLRPETDLYPRSS